MLNFKASKKATSMHIRLTKLEAKVLLSTSAQILDTIGAYYSHLPEKDLILAAYESARRKLEEVATHPHLPENISIPYIKKEKQIYDAPQLQDIDDEPLQYYIPEKNIKLDSKERCDDCGNYLWYRGAFVHCDCDNTEYI